MQSYNIYISFFIIGVNNIYLNNHPGCANNTMLQVILNRKEIATNTKQQALSMISPDNIRRIFTLSTMYIYSMIYRISRNPDTLPLPSLLTSGATLSSSSCITYFVPYVYYKSQAQNKLTKELLRKKIPEIKSILVKRISKIFLEKI